MHQTDVLIVGGGTGGVAAALAAASAGRRCIVTEPTDWVGGQLTSEAVPPDENRWIEDAAHPGGTDSYIDFRNRVRQWYRQNRPLTDAARANPLLNPGNGWVSRLCCEPRIAHEVLQQMLAPHVAAGRIRILLNHQPVSADVSGDQVRSVTFRDAAGGAQTTIEAPYILDATEQGDLLPLAGVEHAIGAEHRDQYGEMHGRNDRADPFDQQAISWCFAIEHRPGENHVIDRPAMYDFWRDWTPPLDPPWPGKLLSWVVVGGDDHRPRTFRFVPWPDEPDERELEMWRYRRIVDHSIYRQPSEYPDVCLVNWVQMDYFRKPLLGVSAQQQAAALQEARQLSLSLLYWMQTEAPRHDDPSKTGYPGLRLRGDELGTADGFAKAPYIREARRLLARFIVTEAHVGTEQRRAEKRPNQDASPYGMAEPFADSVGIGHYRMDLHPSTAMRHSIYGQACPFRIPLGALVPRRVRNVLAAGKCLGVTHLSNGCYRLHAVEWNIGEAAGALAAFCLNNEKTPAQVHEQRPLLRQFQASLAARGVRLSWPWEKAQNL